MNSRGIYLLCSLLALGVAACGKKKEKAAKAPVTNGSVVDKKAKPTGATKEGLKVAWVEESDEWDY